MWKELGREPAPIEEPPRFPMLCGADIELGNFIQGGPSGRDTCAEAAYALLGEIEGQPRGEGCQGDYGHPSSPVPSTSPTAAGNDGGGYHSHASYYGGSTARYGGTYGHNPQDWGRKYLRSNGGCAYIDLAHLELCIPEVLSAYDHVACTHAMLRIARQAQMDANEELPQGQKIHVLANNSDGRGNSYGSHLNFLLTRRTWENIFHRRMHYLLYLAAYQVSSIVFAGQGKVGGENGRPPVPYQICGRGDFFETLVAERTTFRRPIVNSRNEALCGYGFSGADHQQVEPMARLHVIFYDNTLCHVASLLKVGVMQIMLAMIERGQIDPNLILDDPVDALVAWSHDPTLRTRARTASDKELTAVELQMLFLEKAMPFVENGGCDGIVPRAREILATWQDTLVKLGSAALAGDLAASAPLARRLDWVLKLGILRRAMEQHPELAWDSPQIKHLDHLYSSVAPDGLFWAYEKSGFVERAVTDARIERFIHEPPENTRAWTRAMLLRIAGPDAVDHADWDYIRFKRKSKGYWPTYRTLDMGNPLAFTKAESEPILRNGANLDEILDGMGAPRTDGGTSAASPGWWGAEACQTAAPSYSLVQTAPANPSGETGVGETIEVDDLTKDTPECEEEGENDAIP